MRFQIEKLIYGGDGLARLPSNEQGPGKSVFIPFVLPGEQVEAAPTEQKPGFARARLEAVLEASADRISPGCPYFQRCGGCHYQHASYPTQLKIKADILKETLRRTAKLELPCQLQIHPSPEWNYRNRTRLKVQTTPEFAVGYYGFRSHDLLPVEQCPISSPLINRAIQGVWAWGRSGGDASALREIEFFANHADDALLLEVYCVPGTARRDARQLAEELQAVRPEVGGVTVFLQAQAGHSGEPKRLAHSGVTQLRYEVPRSLCRSDVESAADLEIRAYGFKVSAGSFFQVNRFVVGELVSLATAGSGGAGSPDPPLPRGELALDLYAGVGLFAGVLARSFAQVIAVEASQTSFADLQENAPREVKAVSATTEKFLGQASGVRPDFVVVDPPRGGLGESVVRSLARLGPPRVTYVSCDPSTLARDLRSFVSLGYQIPGAHLVDLFPQTFHMETVFHLAR